MGHTAAHQQLVHLREQAFDHLDFIADLGAAHHRQIRPFGTGQEQA